MVNHKPPLSVLAAASLFLLVMLFAPPAFAFDGGYHLDLTRDAMQGSSYGQGAIEAAQVANWYDDGFESAKRIISEDPTAFTIPLEWLGFGDINYPGISSGWGDRFGPSNLRDLSDVYLHFDQLANYNEVKTAWNRLIQNTHRAVLQAQANNDPLGYLTVLGATLHTVQDFYAHANWAELTVSGAWDGEATWFDVPTAVRESENIYTHHAAPGFYHDQMNKDQALRPYFATAYREAYYASDQWVHLLDWWITPAFKDQVLAAQTPDSDKEYEYVRYLCWYSGHWKGPASTSWDDYVILGPDYLDDSNTIYINKWKEYAPLLCADPAPSDTVPMLVIYSQVAGWVKVDTYKVMQTDDDYYWDIDPMGEADFYAYVGVNDRNYLTPMHEDSDCIYPADWLILAPIDPGAGCEWVSFKYDLWDEDAPGPGPSNWVTFRGDDDHCDIVPALYQTIFHEAAGADELAGLAFWSTDGLIYDDGLFSDDGDGNEAQVSFYASWLEPQRRPFEPTIHSAPNSTALPRPSVPLVTDSGFWTVSRTYLHATWTVPGGTEYNPVDEYRYRVTCREIALFMGAYYIPVRPPEEGHWVSAGTTRAANITGLSLEEGWLYYIEVQAHNAGGWSETGRSHGLALDATPPVLSSLGVAQQTLRQSTPTLVQALTSVFYPNSLAITPVASDPGYADASGLWGYVVWVSDLTFRTHEPDKDHKYPYLVEVFGPSPGANVPLSALHDGLLAFADVPLLDGRTYAIRVAAKDWAGNESSTLGVEVVAHFEDRTPPPAPAPETQVRSAADSPLTVRWDEVFDAESGIYEYRVAAGRWNATQDHPDVQQWRSVGRNTAFDIPGVDPHASSTYVNIWVKAVNGAGLESLVASVVYETERGVFLGLDVMPPVAPTAPIRVVVFGNRLTMDSLPAMINGRVMAPMRFIFQALGADVNWIQSTQTVVGTRGSRTIRLTVGQAVGYVNGRPVRLDAPAQVIGGRVFVPLRFIAEALDASVNWNGAQRAVIIE